MTEHDNDPAPLDHNAAPVNAGDAAPIATEVIYEDADVRIWNQIIEPGQTLQRHTHTHDYFLLTVRGEGPLAVEFHSDSGGKLGQAIELRTRRGDAQFIPRGHIETAHNNGDTYRAILVELKD